MIIEKDLGEQYMKIKIISDLHLGVKGEPTNDFLIDEDLFSEYLHDSVSQCDQVILNGDIFELWEDFFQKNESGTSNQAKSLPSMIRTRMKDRMDRIVSSWKFMSEIMTHPKITIINGNHDSMIRTESLITTKEVKDSVTLDLVGHRVYVAHGHQGDFYNQDHSPLRWLSCCCKESLSLMETLIDPSLDQDIGHLADHWVSNSKQILQYANQLSQIIPCELVIFGHTHEATIVQNGKSYYLNDGCLVGKKEIIDELVIESDESKRSVHCSCHQYDLRNHSISHPKILNL